MSKGPRHIAVHHRIALGFINRERNYTESSNLAFGFDLGLLLVLKFWSESWP